MPNPILLSRPGLRRIANAVGVFAFVAALWGCLLACLFAPLLWGTK